jgi:1,4-alpha-glucan branching enzyme
MKSATAHGSTVLPTHTDYSWGYDFNHQSMETQLFVDRVFQYWLTEFRIDGFRLDFTRGFTNRPGSSGAYDASRIAILKRITDRIWQTDSTAFVIIEHLVDDNNELKNLADYGLLLWGNMNYHYNEATMGYNESGKSNFSSVSYKARGWSEPALVGYMESHDEERLMYKNLLYGNSSGDYQIRDLPTALSRMKAAAAFFFTVPGPKMMWQFGELGFDYSIDYNGRLGRKPIRWDYLQTKPKSSFRNRCRVDQTAHLAAGFSVHRFCSIGRFRNQAIGDQPPKHEGRHPGQFRCRAGLHQSEFSSHRRVV